MKDGRGLMRKVRAAALFTDEQVRAIRRADEVGMVTRQQQARTYGVGKETIARICRGETYYWVAQEDELVTDRPEGHNPLVNEPSADEVKASQDKLKAMLEAQNLGNLIIKEMKDDTK